MATREQIFGILAGASAPMGRNELEEKVGESYRRFQTQLDRWVKQELLEDTGGHHYVLTDKGRDEALAEEIGDLPGEELPSVLKDNKEETQHTTGTTEYHQFMRLGKNVGVIPMNLIKVTADHVWNGGDYQDLKWVAQALQEMGIQRDLANRWFNTWRSHLKQPMPTGLPNEFLPPAERKSDERIEAERKDGVGLRNYILSEDNIPVHVGVGSGDLDYKDAFELARIREARRKSDGQPATPGSMADEVTKIFNAFKSVIGDQVTGKSYIVKPSEEGYQVEEVDPNKPLIIPQAVAAKPSPSYYINSEGETQELKPGQPLVIFKDSPRVAGSGTQFLIDQKTGDVREVTPGQPIIIRTESAPVTQATPIQMKDKDGNDIILDINTFIRLEEHKEKQKRDEETHQVKLDIAKGFKDLLKNAQSAFGHMGEDEE